MNPPGRQEYFGRPYGTEINFVHHPALKRRATYQAPLRGACQRAASECQRWVV